jgi:hypothetical protein
MLKGGGSLKNPPLFAKKYVLLEYKINHIVEVNVHERRLLGYLYRGTINRFFLRGCGC